MQERRRLLSPSKAPLLMRPDSARVLPQATQPDAGAGRSRPLISRRRPPSLDGDGDDCLRAVHMF